MKFLTFVDVHGDKKAIKELVKRAKEEDIDFIICAGDFSQFGHGTRFVLEKFNKLGKKFYALPGNHEEERMEIFSEYDNCINFDQKAVKIGNYYFLGYGGGGFALTDEKFRKISREWYSKYKGEKIVLVTHGPPFGCKIDLLEKHHVGNKDFRKFVERIKPKLMICGHLHETANQMDKIGKTKVIHPGWDGMVIELK